MPTLNRMFDAARSLLTRSRPTTPVTGDWTPLDVTLLARELALERRGTERGRREIPRTDQSAFDEVEQEIIQTITSTWTAEPEEAIGTLRALADTIARFDIDTQVAELRLVGRSALARFTAARQRIRGELSRLFETALAVTRELDDFRTAHALTRPAHERSDPIVTGLLLGPIVLIESALNGFLFAEGAEAGLLGGIGIAFGISAVNVSVCFLTGLIPARYMNVCSLIKRSAALLVTVALAMLVFCLHLFAAHYRSAVRRSGETAAYDEALRTLLEAPWRLPDMVSWYLLGLGIVFGIVSAWKGYNQDDPYPHYGAVSRRARDAQEAYDEAYKQLFDELADV